MAYFIAEDPINVIIRPEKQLYAQFDGRHIGVEPEIAVQFHRFVAPEWARTVARESFQFLGKPVIEGLRLEDHVAWLDTEEEARARAWDDSVRALCEERLRNDIVGVVEVQKPLPREPWPNYLELSTARNLELAGVTGFPLDEMLAYESAARNDIKAVKEIREAIEAAQELETIVSA